ncbi:uncharacterized protein PRCAT00002476001 [Priceomyces carsonii]|uniref:uncharacterized protein n=1 Tax=Priceomyces carsonii TaxID=28549 RepID=UPI002EDA9F7B|nr:unnamed protein product [Priceomyces carsonii]
MSFPRISIENLWENLTERTNKWGQIRENEHGIKRLALSYEDQMVRDWFVNECITLGCEVIIDQIGNIFAIYRDVEAPSLAPIGVGSHLDTQPTGGRFDGILGVLASLEILRTIKFSGYKPYHPIAAIDWTNEEGARFPRMCMGSGVWSNQILLEEALSTRDKEQISAEEALQRIGYEGDVPADYRVNKLAAHFELHIEQGPKLEDKLTLVGACDDAAIGVVEGVQAMRWYEICIKGKEGHAGTLSMDKRADALVAASKLVLLIDHESKAIGAVATVGRLVPKTRAPNTIVGEVNLVFDCRAKVEAQLDYIARKVREQINVFEVMGYNITLQKIWGHNSVSFNEECIRIVEEVCADKIDLPTLKMYSAAGHDSAMTANVAPTSMIFVPSRGGVSHNPEEFTSRCQCETGAQILLETVLRFDQNLKMRYKQGRV